MSTQELKRFSSQYRHWSAIASLNLHDESPPGTESEMLPEGDLCNSNSSTTVEWYSVLQLKLLSLHLLRTRASSPLSKVITNPKTSLRSHLGKLAPRLTPPVMLGVNRGVRSQSVLIQFS